MICEMVHELVFYERKIILLPVYVLCTIYLDLTLDSNDPDEPYAEVVISISPILICSFLKYESVTYHETINLLESLYILFRKCKTQNCFHRYPL